MKNILLFFFITIVAVAAVSQDLHYTQFFNSPLTLNPALTGLTRGSYRVGAAYRTQWFGAANTGFFNSPFSTPSVFFDLPVNINDDAIGLGGLFISDQTGANTFSSFTGCVSASFIKGLGKNKEHQLSGGFQIGYTNKSIRASELRFESQFIGTNYYETLNSGENFDALNIGLLNLNTGALWFGKLDRRVSMYAGGSVFNVAQPRDRFLAGSNNRWYLRWNIHTGLDITLGKQVHLLPSLMYMQQGTADQLMPGVSVAYDVTPVATLSVGSLTRMNDFYNRNIQVDATAVYMAFDYKGFKAGLSYDITVSSLRRSRNTLGALELTMIYIGRTKKSKRVIFCPLF